MPAEFTIERQTGLHGHASLAAVAREEGFLFLDRHLKEWSDGTNRFEGPGEILLGAFVDGQLVATAGITRQAPQVGRVRRVYVHPDHRRRGIAEALLAEIVAFAKGHYSELVLFTQTPEAYRLYEKIGFEPKPSERISHRRILHATPTETLNRLLAVLAADPNVKRVGIGGFFPRGVADEVSDLDLWIESESWSPESIAGLLLAAKTRTMRGTPFLHAVSIGGTILDICFGPPIPEDYVEAKLPAPEPLAPAPLPLATIVEEFWMMSLKHRKSVARGRFPLLTYGLHHDRRYLLRAWSLVETGVDPGDQDTLFALNPLFERFVNEERLRLLGLPLRTPDEIVSAIEAYRDEMTRLFPQATPLESIARFLSLRCQN